jgi:hypothetical protein
MSKKKQRKKDAVQVIKQLHADTFTTVRRGRAS